MSYSSIINSAERYFEAIEGLINNTYLTSSNGKVKVSKLDSFIEEKGIHLTGTALKAHLWVKEQLGYGITRWFSKGTSQEWHKNDIRSFYQNINLEEYLNYSKWLTLEGPLTRWKERQAFYTLKGDIDSATFCAWNAELTALAMETQYSVKELRSKPEVLEDIEARLGTFDPNNLDRAGLEGLLPK